MSEILYEKMVLQYLDQDMKDETIAKKIRIIWIEPLGSYACYVKLDSDTSMPCTIQVQYLENEVEAGVLREIPDPYIKPILEENIPVEYRKRRDAEWEVVQFLWESEKQLILSRNDRPECIKRAARKFGLTELRVKRIISRFWQRGMNKNALLIEYQSFGAKGKMKSASEKKRGRPRKTEYKGEEGVNVDDNLRKIIDIVIKTYYRRKEKPSLMDTYQYMLQKFFSDKRRIGNKEEIVIWDKGQIPPYHQFYYWFKKLEDFKEDYMARYSEKSFALKRRELLGNSTMEVFGPGSRYQIDATIADVYLMSSVNKEKIIGRPVVYAVIDVFSRLICGIYVGLEGPSWIGAMMALDNVISDKVEFCQRYGIDITEDEWPQAFLPETILADRGEFEGYSVENMINNLNVKVENTPPYRGDLKGIVERHFRTVNERIKHLLPGAIEKQYRERGDRDYRLDAKLTLEEFNQIYICEVLSNNKREMKKYPMERQLIIDGVPPIPVELWKWGVVNRKGRFNKFPEDIVRLNLLPRAKANVSRDGIKFKKLFYSTEKAIEEQWFINHKKKSIDIVYDPRNMNYIYIPSEDGRQYDKCFLLEKSFMYRDLSLEEIIFQQELQDELIENSQNTRNQNISDRDMQIREIIEKANNRAKQEASAASRNSQAEKIRDIRENKAVEKNVNRQKEHFELGNIEEKEGEVVSIQASENNDLEVKDNHSKSVLNMLKKKRDEKLGKG